MRLVNPIYCLLVQTLSVCQEMKFSMIIKTFVTLGIISVIDQMFAGVLPKALKTNAQALNSARALRMAQDQNSWSMIWHRVKKDPKALRKAVPDLLVNCLWMVIINFQIVFINYFAVFLTIIIQYIGYIYQIS
jgi:hypothetical protein